VPVARLEHIPICFWHAKARLILGIAKFFDAFDALMIVQVLPVLVHLWKLSGPEIGVLIAAGFVGQLLGALFFGWLAGRVGRLWSLTFAIAIFSSKSVLSGFAGRFTTLLILRFAQGVGLGGEVPVAAVYQRSDQSPRSRQVSAAIRACLQHRPTRQRLGQPDRHPPLGIGMDVPHRRNPRRSYASPESATSRVAAMARCGFRRW
jgi:hypothetical protein